MKPTLERSDQVVAHVVAWHNRHPLAQRITADQVHSVGVVSLPFAVRGARQAAAAEAEGPVEAVEASPVDPAPPAPAAEAPPQADPSPEAVADPATESAAPADAAIEAVVEFEPDAAGDAPTAPDSAPAPPPAPSILDRALDTPAASPSALTVSPPNAEEPFVTGLPARPAELPPRPQPWHPRSWWARLRGQAPFHALFSEDFIAPLRPRQVRAWAARHGVGRRPLEPQAPQRLIVLDAARRRAGDDTTEVDLHLITAAIGVGDSRHRLLLAPDGSVLGRRQLNRPRVAAAASALALLGGLGGGWVWHRGPHGAEALAQHTAPAASAASASASAASAGAHAAASPASSAVASASSPAASSAVAHAPAAGTVPAPEAASASASAPVATTAAAEAASTAEPATAAAAPPAEVASAPRSVNPRRGRIELPPLVPRLAAAERHEVRTSSRELRGQPAAGPDTKAWALVTAPLSDRRQSERVAAQLHAIALLQPMPMRAELMPAGKGWRAVFWPFPTAQDAEKVRLALADKGLRTEVLEF